MIETSYKFLKTEESGIHIIDGRPSLDDDIHIEGVHVLCEGVYSGKIYIPPQTKRVSTEKKGQVREVTIKVLNDPWPEGICLNCKRIVLESLLTKIG